MSKMHNIKGKELSEETIVNACEEALGISFEEKEFKPIRKCCLVVGIKRRPTPITIYSDHSGQETGGHSITQPLVIVERYNVNDAKQFIRNIESAIAFIENET